MEVMGSGHVHPVALWRSKERAGSTGASLHVLWLLPSSFCQGLHALNDGNNRLVSCWDGA